MMKIVRCILVITCLISFSAVKAQEKMIESLKTDLKNSRPDTNRVNILAALVRLYYQYKPDTALILGQEGYELAQHLNYPQGEALMLNRIAAGYSTVGDYAKALLLLTKALTISQGIHDPLGISRALNNIGDTYLTQGDYHKALGYFIQTEKVQRPLNDTYGNLITFLNLGQCYLHLNQQDSALFYLKSNYDLVMQSQHADLYGEYQRTLGEVESVQHHEAIALAYFNKSISSYEALDDRQDLSVSYQDMARLYEKNNQQDSAIYYAQKALGTAQTGSYNLGILNASKMLADYYELNSNIPEAFKYYKIATAAKDSLYSEDKVKQILSISFEEKQRQQQMQAAQTQYENKIKFYALFVVLGIFLLLATILWRNNRQKQIANGLLQKQKQAIESTLSELKTTQKQLIQSEKMASLGELAAGVAHEIQNPLNFVNNFSELNTELLAEMQQNIDSSNFEEVKEIANDIIENQQKINHHGKRADAIVKGMLEHSRSNAGQKELKDINALADEYLRLSYHGLRAKDKSFNADFTTDFDTSIGKINVVPQDMGRVLLNLYNNAFYAVAQKKKQLDGNYQPKVTVSTKKLGNKVQIHVKDNGTGIPQDILDKIFQPFFTTKPTGDGTGLGLSLSYDIIKTHNGQLNVESKEGVGTDFMIELQA